MSNASRSGAPEWSKDSRFWDKTARKYAASPIKNADAYRQTLDHTRRYLSPSDRVLEVGCGTGSTALLLAPDVAHITATDFSAEMIVIGEAKAREQQVDNVDFARAALPNGDWQNEAYDEILAFNALHLVRELEAALRDLHRALKPGGVFISKTVCLAEQTRLWALPLSLMRLLGFAPYVNLLTFAVLEQTISGAGFRIEETELYPPPISRFIVARKD